MIKPPLQLVVLAMKPELLICSAERTSERWLYRTLKTVVNAKSSLRSSTNKSNNAKRRKNSKKTKKMSPLNRVLSA
jgi:hypothetical protein